MIDKDSRNTREFIRVLFEKTKSRDFVACSLAFIKNEDNMRAIIDYIRNNPSCTRSDIDFEITCITEN